MNDDFIEENLLKSMKLNYISNQNNNKLNSLQFFSTPNLKDFRDEYNNKIERSNLENEINNNKNNGLNNNVLNISENELFNFELDQSTESIINNQSISHQMAFGNSLNINNIDNNMEKDKINSGQLENKVF